MVRILHTADWHWGAHSGHPVLSSFVQKIFETATQYKCDYILVAGDIFDKPRPDQQIKDSLAAELLNHLKDIPVVFSVGNHDYTTKTAAYHSLNYINYLKCASEFGGADRTLPIYLMEPGSTLSFDDVHFLCLKNLTDIHEEDGTPRVGIWHGTVPGMTFEFEVTAPKAAKDLVSDCVSRNKLVYLALGDIHKPIKLTEQCWYSGPPVQKTFSDTSGIIIVDIADNKVRTKKLDLDLPKKITIDIDSSEEVPTEDMIEKFVLDNCSEGNYLKIKLHLPLTVWAGLNTKRIKESLETKFLEVRFDNTPVTEKRQRQFLDKIQKAKTIEEELSHIISFEETSLKKDLLQKLCNKYIKKLG